MHIRAALATAVSPAVMCSFGKDSMLLLALVREINMKVPVLWFRTGLNEKFGKKIIREWGLTAYSWAPQTIYPIGRGTLIAEYSFGNETLPMVIDTVAGKECVVDKFRQRTPKLFLPFDLILVGYKDTDEHWVKGDAHLFPEDLKLDKAAVKAPLRHLTDEQVRAALLTLKVPYATEDELPVCTLCTEPGEDKVWCQKENRYISRVEWQQSQAVEDAFIRRIHHGKGLQSR